MTDYIGNYKNRPRRVVFYGRVSTEHEEQLSALGNQMEWYTDLALRNPNWTVVAQYIDEGITGTQMKKRPSFMRMIEHAKEHRFDLIVTRELSRFARNTVDALNATRELKQYGVEVYFVNDGIWTMDGDGEVRLTIMASIAQDESRKTSERVKAGQKMSREKGVLYGSGNIIGYDRVDGTYVINEEQAATVRRIFNLYAEGHGETTVAKMLIEENRKDGGGGLSWTASKVSRVLRKPTYKGYMTYNKSHIDDFLSHNRINHSEEDFVLVKGNFEPIVSEALWETCNQIRSKRAAFVKGKDGRAHKFGVSFPQNKWTKILFCDCGMRFQIEGYDKTANGGKNMRLICARSKMFKKKDAARALKRIFAMTIDGYGPYQIASKLKEEKVLIPSAYLARHGEGVNKNKTFKDVYGWGSSTICNILEKREYLGHTINFKTRKHFKDKKSHYVPEDEWTIFENTHEAIIDQQTFDLVQKIRGNVRRYPDGWGEAAPLTGLLYCADCGGKMYVHRTNNGKRISQYTCSQYSKVPVGKLCKTQHRINEDVVLSLVSEMLKAIAEYAKHDRAEFVRVVQEAQSSQQTAEVKKQRTRLATAKQRVSELEVLLCKIYEDNILGKLSDSRYATLDAQYEKEQSELNAEISTLEKAVKSYEKHEKDADRFIALIDKYENFDKLTIAMLNEFIEKILVHERDRKGSIQTTQEVEIYFNFVGRFVPPAFGEAELTPEELEEIRKREERKDRLHQNYLKRKASGAQKRYEDKIKGRKKAEIEAKKAAIRAEDIAKGVFVPVSSLPQREPMKGVQTA